MALIDQEGHYIKINKYPIMKTLELVQYHIYRDQETRENPTEFDLSPEESTSAIASEEVVNSIVSSMYTQMKTQEKFKNCIDI